MGPDGLRLRGGEAASVPEGRRGGFCPREAEGRHPQSLSRHRTFPLLQKLWLGSSPRPDHGSSSLSGAPSPLSRGASAVIADDGPLRPDTAFLLLTSAAKNALGCTHCVSPQSRGHSPEPPPRPVAAPTFPRPPGPLHTGGGQRLLTPVRGAVSGGQPEPRGRGGLPGPGALGSGELCSGPRQRTHSSAPYWDENSADRRGHDKPNTRDGTSRRTRTRVLRARPEASGGLSRLSADSWFRLRSWSLVVGLSPTSGSALSKKSA